MEKKTILITGATGTIGKATATRLAKNGCHIILLGRNPDKVSAVKAELMHTSGNKDIDVAIADLSEPASVRKATKDITNRYGSLNALVNTAAIYRKNRLENSGGLEYMFATNHLGPFVLSNELIGLLQGSKGRIITVTAPSTTKINFEDPQGKKNFSPGFLGAFGASKMMNLLFTFALAKRLEGTNVTANAFHPGLVKSDLTSEMPPFLNFIFKQISGKPDKAAGMISRLAIDPDFENMTGKFYKFDGKELKANKYAYDKDVQNILWGLSEQLAG